MNKQVTFFLAAVGFGLLLSSTPVVAQNQGNGQGQGPEAVIVCGELAAVCTNANALGGCVSTGNCLDSALRTGNADLFELCCAKCVAAATACGVPNPEVFCSQFGC